LRTYRWVDSFHVFASVAGYFQNIPNVYADLGQIVAGQKPGRENDQERIMSMNLGLAIGDMAVAIRVYERAR
jgi:ornithine cyclodeaminase/alanine dehydrogenase-like protein (mu-crystallin family)